MPKLGMEPIRRAALVKATIAEIGLSGTLDVTVAQIARRAGMSPALAHHYFGGKDQIFLAAMRHVLTIYGDEVRAALSDARTPRERLEAIVRASFAPVNFRREAVNAWLNFYLLAQSNDEARRLLSIYHRRLDSNLRHELRRLKASDAVPLARSIAAMIDGAYLREALARGAPDAEGAVAMVLALLSSRLDA